MFVFEKLEAWQTAIDLADLVYATTRAFPAEERFGLTNQMRRAAVSVSSNLAEGSSRASRPDFARFVGIATGSVFEVVSEVTVAHRQGYLPEPSYRDVYASALRQTRILSGLRSSLLRVPRKP